MLTTDTAWGSGHLNTNNTQLKVGKSSSDTYVGTCAFAAIPKTYSVKKLTLYLNRTDGYNQHVLQIGGTTSGAYGAALTWSANITVPEGAAAYAFDLTAYAKTIQDWGAAWYLHIRHGSGSNSYCEFVGDEGSASTKPRLVVEYDQGIVYYGVNGKWQPCLVYYGTGGKWVQVIPYYGAGGKWVQV